MKPDDYRKQAAACLRLVDKVGNTAAKLALIDMAQVWLKLADQAEKNGKTDLVYETPARRSDRGSEDSPAN